MVAIPRLTVRTEFGSVMAVPHRGSLLFHNVPYAASPFGRRRFQPPAPPVIWDGLRDGAKPGAGLPQPRMVSPVSAYFLPVEQSEDALTLEITTPELGLTGLPVVVWFHGGGFITGAASAPANAGFAFARDGIVHVSVNSRLGIDGYAFLDGMEDAGVDNLGLRDQVAALEWIQRNIARFGGDPDRVTIAGQSTGGTSVDYLLASPAAKGLFVRAISQSGSPALFATKTEARGISRRVAELAGVAPTIEAMSALSLEDTSRISLQVFEEVYGNPNRWGLSRRIPLPFCGVIGTETLPEAPVSALAAGASHDVAILAGTTRHEAVAIFLESFNHVSIDSDDGRSILDALGADDATVARVRAQNPAISDICVLGHIASSTWAIEPTLDLLAAHRGEAYLYEFAWESPMLERGSGSAQGIDVPFVLDDFETVRDLQPALPLFGDHLPRTLATSMHSAFAEFVRTGRPGWEPFTVAEPMRMTFDDRSESRPAPELVR